MILIVTGLGGSVGSIDALSRRYSKFAQDVVPYHRYWSHRFIDYELYVGHSYGAIVIQNDLRVPAYKIHVYGMVAYRGKQKQGFFEGHPVN